MTKRSNIISAVMVALVAFLAIGVSTAQAGIIVTVTVGSPSASIVRASTGTLRQQSGQVGVTTTASTPSSRIRATTAGT